MFPQSGLFCCRLFLHRHFVAAFPVGLPPLFRHVALLLSSPRRMWMRWAREVFLFLVFLRTVKSASQVGKSVYNIGDISGDGMDDILLSSAVSGGSTTSMAYVLYGGKYEEFGQISMNSLISSGVGFGVILPGASICGSGAGDLNGDFVEDFMIGVSDSNKGRGMVYVIYGRSDFPSSLDVTSMSREDGYWIVGVSNNEKFGSYILNLNTDRRFNSTSTFSSTSRCSDVMIGSVSTFYVLRCSLLTSSDMSSIYISDLNHMNSYTISTLLMSQDSPVLNAVVINAGDLNGDGVNDMAVSFPSALSSGGIVYVVYGCRNGTSAGDIDLDRLLPEEGFHMTVSDASAALGVSMSYGGDVNGDGVDDLVIGSYLSGVYVVYGKPRGGFVNKTLNTDLSLTEGFRITDSMPKSLTGYSVAGNVDANRDGISDVVVGCPFDPNKRYVYVLYGSRTGENIDLSNMQTHQGFAITSSVKDRTGYVVGGGVDMNSDGFNDVMVGSTQYSSVLVWRGALHVVVNINGSSTSAPTQVPNMLPIPTRKPTFSPSFKPSRNPSVTPSRMPTIAPSTVPSSHGPSSSTPSRGENTFDPTSSVVGNNTSTSNPSCDPSKRPTKDPSAVPLSRPTGLPTLSPTGLPTVLPVVRPTLSPSSSPTSRPSADPTLLPSIAPTACSPSSQPSQAPTNETTPIDSIRSNFIGKLSNIKSSVIYGVGGTLLFILLSSSFFCYYRVFVRSEEDYEDDIVVEKSIRKGNIVEKKEFLANGGVMISRQSTKEDLLRYFAERRQLDLSSSYMPDELWLGKDIGKLEEVMCTLLQDDTLCNPIVYLRLCFLLSNDDASIRDSSFHCVQTLLSRATSNCICSETAQMLYGTLYHMFDDSKQYAAILLGDIACNVSDASKLISKHMVNKLVYMCKHDPELSTRKVCKQAVMDIQKNIAVFSGEKFEVIEMDVSGSEDSRSSSEAEEYPQELLDFMNFGVNVITEPNRKSKSHNDSLKNIYDDDANLHYDGDNHSVYFGNHTRNLSKVYPAVLRYESSSDSFDSGSNVHLARYLSIVEDLEKAVAAENDAWLDDADSDSEERAANTDKYSDGHSQTCGSSEERRGLVIQRFQENAKKFADLYKPVYERCVSMDDTEMKSISGGSSLGDLSTEQSNEVNHHSEQRRNHTKSSSSGVGIFAHEESLPLNRMSDEGSDGNDNSARSYTWTSSKIDMMSSSDESIFECNTNSSRSTLTRDIDELVPMNSKDNRVSSDVDAVLNYGGYGDSSGGDSQVEDEVNAILSSYFYSDDCNVGNCNNDVV